MLEKVQRLLGLMKTRGQNYDDLFAASNLDETVSWTRTHQLHGFNTSAIRLRIVCGIARAFGATHFIETGTYHAATAACARQCLGLPVWSCEVSLPKYLVARAVTIGLPDVKLWRADSRKFLAMAAEKLRSGTDVRPIFYLDAHDDGGPGSTRCPLLDELELILSLKSFAILIDDFAVPAGGFVFHRYGGMDLCLDSIRDPLAFAGVNRVFFPKYPASLETGHGRAGYTVFFRSAALEREFETPGFPFNLLDACELSQTDGRTDASVAQYGTR